MFYFYGIYIIICVVGSENIKTVVLDEADEILSRGFKDQICDILPMLPENIQIMILSATMPYDVSEFTTKYMVDPVKIIVKKEEKTLEGIRQFYVLIEREVNENTSNSIIRN